MYQKHQGEFMATPQDAVQLLISILESLNSGAAMKAAAAEGLGYAGGFDARAALIRVLTSPNRGLEVRAAAAKALGHAARE